MGRRWGRGLPLSRPIQGKTSNNTSPAIKIANMCNFLRSRWFRSPAAPVETGRVEACADLSTSASARSQARSATAFFKSLADNNPLFIGMCDMDYLPFYVNDAGRRLVGLDDGRHVESTPVKEYFFPEDQDFILNCFFPRVLGDGRAETEVRFRHFKSGEPIWMIYNVFRLKDEQGRAMGLATVSRDITERKRAEAALHESEERFSAIIESAMDAIIALDGEQRILLFNAAAEKMFGCTAAEAVGAPIDRFIPERFRVAHRAGIRRFGESGATTRAMGRLGVCGLRASGEEFPIEASISQLAVEDKRIFTVILRDITERQRTTDALRQSEERFASFMRHLPGLAWIKNAEGQYEFVNNAAEKAFQTPRAKLYGKTDEEIFPPDTAAQFRANDAKALESDTGCVTIETLRHDDGVLHHSLVSKFAIGDAARYRGIAGVAIDITERVIAEKKLLEATEQLCEADRRKDEFLAMLAHELRNPLAPIHTGLQVLRKSRGHEDTAERVLGMMERQVKHLVRLVDDLLEVSRISRGKIELKKEQIDLAVIIDHAVDMSRELIDASGLTLRVALPDEPLLIDADPVRLAQVFANLLNNAAKFTSRGGRIELTAERKEGEAVVSVADTGVGIARDMLPRVFELFVQVDNSLVRAKGGLGLGLALVRSLVDLHGGKVEAASEGEGCGSRFTVRLPLSTKAGMQAQPSQSPTRAIESSRRALVVDDKQDVADSLAFLLKTLGAKVRIAYSGAQALAACAEFAPEIVFLDIGMPEMDGFETARRMREQSPGKKAVLVALTGWGEQQMRRRINEAGFDQHLTKPADIGEIERLLQAARPKDPDLPPAQDRLWRAGDFP
jgi:PAS domain S-box-containing protein